LYLSENKQRLVSLTA